MSFADLELLRQGVWLEPLLQAICQPKTGASIASAESGYGPIRPTWAPRQVGSFLRYTGREANILAEAAHGPEAEIAGRGASSPLFPFADASI